MPKKKQKNPRKVKGLIRTSADLDALAVGEPGDEIDLMLGRHAVKHPELSAVELIRRYGRKKRAQ